MSPGIQSPRPVDFTIVTPSLNYGRFLGDCLASVAAQEGVTVEHLVHDGGSTDDSAAVAARHPHARWVQAQDNGMSQAINRGFDAAQGEWVMWLNADDRLKPGALAAMLEHLRASTMDIVYGDFDFTDEAGTHLRTVRLPGWSPFVHVHHHCYIGSTAAFYRRSSVIAAGYRLREDFRYVMDGEYYARLHAAGLSFGHVPVTVADFRLHGGNASMRHLGKSRDLEVILRAERQHVESRAIRRAYGITLFDDPYLNGLADGVLWIAARGWKMAMRTLGK
ncbi:glycosyltransferase [Luteolibacter flavescens]|uniref:Glycosyltransferase n=1 Tax=Luteolibacter flavescens TaxID=1859460 RepID=A0ABT3FNJ3_9BACT|nr:glycosyltransferase family 2 protein [Luteolibacter flavescens]MCW1885146.1 glycosyltransferase [Luteolibacter flavescens]